MTRRKRHRFRHCADPSAFGLAATGGIEYGWNSIEQAIKNGIFFNARRN